MFPRKAQRHGEVVRCTLRKEVGFKADVPVRSANLCSDFSEKFLSCANSALFEEGPLPREHHAMDVKCRLDLQRELQLIPGRPHLNAVKLHCFTQKSDGVRLRTAFRATRRRMDGCRSGI